MKKKILNIEISEETHHAFKTKTITNRETMADILRSAINNYLKA